MERTFNQAKYAKKGLLTLPGSIAFVATLICLVSIANEHDRHDPAFVTTVAYIGIIVFSLAGSYIFYKWFDAIPGMIVLAVTTQCKI